MDRESIINFLQTLSHSLSSLGLKKTASEVNSLVKESEHNGYIIVHASLQNQYWSNDLGWSKLEEADIYNRDAVKGIALPTNGKWLKISL